MNKSALTNGVALLVALAGFAMSGPMGQLVLNVGMYALSGSATNWLAIYMLFEKVPFCYGSGVIPARFDEFRVGIRQMVMEQFFNEDNLNRFLAGESNGAQGPTWVDTLMSEVDFDRAFDGLVEVVRQSTLGGMLMMFGGEKALQPLRAPFIAKMEEFIRAAAEDPQLLEKLRHDGAAGILERVERLVDKRLDELTPQMVKEIIENMISRHLGWLVVWGGVLGGLIGLLVSLPAVL